MTHNVWWQFYLFIFCKGVFAVNVGLWTILLFLGLAIFLGVAGVGISRLISPYYYPNEEGLEKFECGVDTEGTAWVQFKISYFMYALIFILFDIETIFFVPFALIFKEASLVPVVSGSVFLLILTIGLWYEWKEGALEWQ